MTEAERLLLRLTAIVALRSSVIVLQMWAKQKTTRADADKLLDHTEKLKELLKS